MLYNGVSNWFINNIREGNILVVGHLLETVDLELIKKYNSVILLDNIRTLATETFPDHFFDSIIVTTLLEFNGEAFREVYRVARKDSVLLISSMFSPFLPKQGSKELFSKTFSPLYKASYIDVIHSNRILYKGEKQSHFFNYSYNINPLFNFLFCRKLGLINQLYSKIIFKPVIKSKQIKNAGKILIKGSIEDRKKLQTKFVNKFIKNKSLNITKEHEISSELFAFMEDIKNSNVKHIVFMFSGTSFIQDYNGNRPIKLTQQFIKKNIPVLFSYWRWNIKENVPENKCELLFQTPIDVTLKYMSEIANYDFGDKKKLFIISFPYKTCGQIIQEFNHSNWITIYDVRDEWEEFYKVGQAVWFNKYVERDIVEKADVVCAVSKTLLQKMQHFTSKKVNLNPNALDASFLNSPKIKSAPRTGTKIIGYIGHLTDAWFDWEAIIKIAAANRDLRFEIIGHSLPSNIVLPENIIYIGPKKPREIRFYTQNWRVAIIPFRISKLADGVDPIKVYEYLALGLPIVSFRMPQIHDYPYVYIANTTEEFQQKLYEAMTVNINVELIADFLKDNYWSNRAEQFLQWSKIQKSTPK
ncbi:glycosyltransferase [Paenibacillus sp. 2KB_22]|uniref:glycosyltransferase n=1 Tax=Paenibacillus sp. 2KB_22 TaxID=3232978 RepID=UPI003F9DF869